MARLLVVPATLLLAACPSAPGQPVDPAAATAKDVEGWWLHLETPGPNASILGLLSEAEARRQLPVEENGIAIPPGQGVSTLYATTAQGGAVPGPWYVATWSLEKGALVEDVLATRDGPSEELWSTPLRALTPRQSITLASTMDPSGQRTRTWYDRCPVFDGLGWHAYAAPFPDCPPSITTGNALAFDPEGNVHATMGVAAASRCSRATYAYVTKGCEPRRYALPNFGASALEVRDGVVRIALATLEGKLLAFEGPVGALTFTQALIDNGPVTAHGLRFLAGAARPTLLAQAQLANGGEEVAVYTLEGAAWSKRPGGPAPFAFASTLAPNGDVVFVRDGALRRVRLDGADAGVPVPLPGPWTVQHPPALTADGRVQVVMSGRNLGTLVGGRVLGVEGLFAEWDGQRWQQASLGLMYEGLVVTSPGGPTRVITSTLKAAIPPWALYELDGGAVVASERMSAGSLFGFGPGATPDYRWRPAAAAHPSGAIAFSYTGEIVNYRGVDGVREAPQTSVTLSLVGTGRARVLSPDGRVDCSATCEVTGRAGERIPIRLVADPGSAARMACAESTELGLDRCYLDLLGTGRTFEVETKKLPWERVLAAGNPGGTATTSRVSSRGDRALLQVDFQPGRLSFLVGSTELVLPAYTPRALVGFDRATGTGWATPLPEPALALQALPGGGGWVVLAVFGVVEFGGRQLGAPNLRQVLRVRVDEAGRATDSALLIEAPLLADLAAALGPDGTAVVAFRSGNQPTAQLARLDAAGASSQGSLAVDAAPRLAWVDGERTLVAAGTGVLVAAQGVTVTGSRTIANATVRAVAVRGGRAVVALSSPVMTDVGSGPRAPGDYLVQYDPALAVTGEVAARAVAVAAFDDGVVAMVTNQATRGTWAARYDLSLAQVGALADLDLSNVTITSSGQDEDSLVLLGVQTGGAMFDGFNLAADSARTWVIEVAR